MGWVSGGPLPVGRNELAESTCGAVKVRWHAKRRGMLPPAFVAADEAFGVRRCGCALARRAASTLAAHLR